MINHFYGKPLLHTKPTVQAVLTQAKGKAGEALAYAYLSERGLLLVERNYRCRLGELDLIMRDGSYLVFVEVRSRRNSRYGSPAETVTYRKQQKLLKAASFYLQRRRHDGPCRFDIVAINRADANAPVQWIKDAFQAY